MLRPRSARHNIVVAFLILIVGLVGAWGLLPSPAHAASCGDAETSIISCDAAKSGTEAAKDSANNPIIAVLTFVMQILTGAVGIAAVGALIYAGILYSAAGGEAGQVQKAKTLIKDTVIGIICYAGMILILNFVIPGGVFGQQSTTGSGTAASSASGSGGSSSSDNPTAISGMCYWKVFATPPDGKWYHRSGSVPYAFEDSQDGVRYASSHGYDRIDLDLQLTKDGVVVVSHTPKPLGQDRILAGFYDTAGKITDHNITISELTFAEVSRLKHKDGYRIYSLEYLIGVATEVKLGSLYLELKTPKSLKSHLPEIAAMLNKNQTKAIIGGQTTHAGQLDALAYARRLGFWTRNITAHTWTKPSRDDALCKSLGS